MEDLVAILFLIALIAMIVGLIKPGLVVRWGSDRSRKAVLKTYGLVFLVSMFIFAAISSDYKTGKEAYDSGDYQRAITRLSKVKSTDDNYQSATELLAEAKRKLSIQSVEKAKKEIASGNVEEAISLLSAVPKDSENAKEVALLLDAAVAQKEKSKEASSNSAAAAQQNVQADQKVEASKTKEESSPEITEKAIGFGTPIETDYFSIVVPKVAAKKSVGDEMFGQEAPDGATYVVVRYQYKNKTSKPINAFRAPQVYLLSPDNEKYDPDLGASSVYATEVNLNEKVLSDINPGITIKAASVFEVSKEQLSRSGWRVLLDADENFEIPFRY